MSIADDPEPKRLIPVAEYRRASTDQQRYSTENQSIINRSYAIARGMEIIRTYIDEGISGLSFDQRPGLRQMIEDVQTDAPGFKAILVYDVSRWGRFQDPDESAHYEFLCKRAGIAVHYCAELFLNDGSPLSAIVKAIKRGMAGEYSRDLSEKVFRGQSHLIRLGFSQGASAPFGMRRELVGPDGKVKGFLNRGECKSLKADRVRIVPGPPAEIEVVRWIFEEYTSRKARETQIAHILNRRGILNSSGGLWTYGGIRRLLANERYIGNNVWNRTSGKLKAKRKKNSPGEWVRADGSAEPIVSRQLFAAVQTILRASARKPGPDDRLAPLRSLFIKHGYLNAHLIDRSAGVPSVCSYIRWFGSLYRVYELVGFVPAWRRVPIGPHPLRLRYSDERLLELLRQVLINRGYLNWAVVDETPDIPSSALYRKRFGSLRRAFQLIGYAHSTRHQRDPNRGGNRGKYNRTRLLAELRRLLDKHGYLSSALIDSSSGSACTATYAYRFGSLRQAYLAIGYRPPYRNRRPNKPKYTDDYLLDELRHVFRENGHLSFEVLRRSRGTPVPTTYIRRFGSLGKAFALIGYRPGPSAGRHSRKAKPLRTAG
jgi:DNA invertase Pin-like site-specific DNA recombinase